MFPNWEHSGEFDYEDDPSTLIKSFPLVITGWHFGVCPITAVSQAEQYTGFGSMATELSYDVGASGDPVLGVQLLLP